MPLAGKWLKREDWLAICGSLGLLIACQVIGDNGTSVLGYLSTAAGIEDYRLRVMVAMVALFLTVLVGLLLARSDPRPGNARQSAILFVTFLALVLSNTVPVWFEEAIGLNASGPLWRITVGVLTLLFWVLLSAKFLPAIQHSFQTPVDLGASAGGKLPDGPVTVIVIVSRVDQRRYRLEFSPTGATLTRDSAGDARVFRLACESLDQDIAALKNSNWSWQQILRGVSRYAPRSGLRVILVGSKSSSAAQEGGGSFDQLTLLKNLLELYPELRNATVEQMPKALDFEDFNEVKNTIRDCIREQCVSVKEMNVFVDITGGQKMASAAAAVATIGTMGQFQYVQTNDPWHVLVSDLHPQVSPSMGA